MYTAEHIGMCALDAMLAEGALKVAPVNKPPGTAMPDITVAIRGYHG